MPLIKDLLAERLGGVGASTFATKATIFFRVCEKVITFTQ
jgi:hypothetical protein